MTADPPVGEPELDADGWPVGMTREQILAAAGVTEEEARRCERLATLSESSRPTSNAGCGRLVLPQKYPQAAAYPARLSPYAPRSWRPSGRQISRSLCARCSTCSQSGALSQHPMDAQADDLGDFFDQAAAYYRQDLWVRSDVYVEVWCEKDALAGALMSITREYDVPLMVARGYSSETFAYSAAETMRETGKPCYVYHVGDFDPSGWQVARNLEDKLSEFGAPVVFEHLAVNPEQIQTWALPTRPSKVTDARCKAFFAKFGDSTPSVELDAIHPDLLCGLVGDAIEQHIDYYQLEALRREEGAAREVLQELAQGGFD
jgi:hypothetical protein